MIVIHPTQLLYWFGFIWAIIEAIAGNPFDAIVLFVVSFVLMRYFHLVKEEEERKLGLRK